VAILDVNADTKAASPTIEVVPQHVNVAILEINGDITAANLIIEVASLHVDGRVLGFAMIILKPSFKPTISRLIPAMLTRSTVTVFLSSYPTQSPSLVG
jgi:hypothetical protein